MGLSILVMDDGSADFLVLTSGGPRGRQGVQGIQGIPGVVIANHGGVADTARPVSAVVYWIGTARPVNALPTDFWLNS